MRNVYGHVVIAVDQSHAFRIFHSAFYWHPYNPYPNPNRNPTGELRQVPRNVLLLHLLIYSLAVNTNPNLLRDVWCTSVEPLV